MKDSLKEWNQPREENFNPLNCNHLRYASQGCKKNSKKLKQTVRFLRMRE